MTTQNEAARLLILGVIADTEPEMRQRIDGCLEFLRGWIDANGDEGYIALSLVAIEESIKADKETS